VNKDFRLALGSSLLVALGTVACEDEAAVVTAEPHPTVIEVVPQYFLSADRCVDAPGGVRSYLATLFDMMSTVEDETDDFALPSSEVVPCSRSIAFGWVVPGHSYRTEIQAFDRDGLQVLTPGVPVVVDASNGYQPVLPRWTAHCGPTRAEAALTQRAIPCKDLQLAEPGGTTNPTVVEVGIEAALTDVPCGQADGEIASFLVRRAIGPLDPAIEVGRAACGERVRLETLTPGEFVELEVLAFSSTSSETAILGGICSSTVVAGVTLTAHCSPFQAKGAITLDVPTLLAAAGARCDASLTSFSVTLDGGADSRSFRASSCAGTNSFASLAPGTHTLEAALVVRDAAPLTLLCTAKVEPGLAAAPTCHTL
jgi:hypothetical protein